jgi:hypothetical protein
MSRWPRTYQRAQAPREMVALIDRVMPLLLAGDEPLLVTLRAQYARTTLERLDLTGVGFFAHFSVPQDAPTATPPDFVCGAAQLDVGGVVHGAGCALFVRSGVLDFLEGFTYEDEWPEHPKVLAIHHVSPVTEACANGTGNDGPSR